MPRPLFPAPCAIGREALARRTGPSMRMRMPCLSGGHAGMFSYTGLGGLHCDTLRERHHVYLTRDGRMSMAGK